MRVCRACVYVSVCVCVRVVVCIVLCTVVGGVGMVMLRGGYAACLALIERVRPVRAIKLPLFMERSWPA